MFHGVARVNERKGGETRREEPCARRRGRGSFLRPTRKFLAFLITALAELITGKCNGNLGGRRERKRATRARRMRTRKRERDRDSRAFQSTLPYLLLLSLSLPPLSFPGSKRLFDSPLFSDSSSLVRAYTVLSRPFVLFPKINSQKYSYKTEAPLILRETSALLNITIRESVPT